MGAILFVKFGELVEIVEVGSVACRDYKATLVKYTMNILTSFDQIDLLASSSKMEAL
jgi:predicted nucleotidyltransferase